MFGIKQLKNKIDDFSTKLLCLEASIDGNTKELHHYADRGATILKYTSDAKVDISILKNRIGALGEQVLQDQVKFNAELIRLNTQLDCVLFNQNSLKEEIDIIKNSLNQICQHLTGIEPLLASLEVVTERCIPIMPVPKLPKTKKATTEDIKKS